MSKYWKRYGVQLLFQWRSRKAGKNRAKRLCEKRIIVIKARTYDELFKKITQYGKSNNYSFKNCLYETTFFEYVGILDICELEVIMEENEVWYEIARKLRPMERKRQLTMNKEEMIHSLETASIDNLKRNPEVVPLECAHLIFEDV